MLGLLIVAAPLAAQAAPAPKAPKVEPEVPVTPTDLSYAAANNSPSLAVDPTEPRFVAAAHRVDAPSFSCGLQVSADGGRGWVGTQPVPKLPAGAERCYAPEVAFDRAGTLYYLFVGLQGAGNAPMGVFLTTSANRGRSFSTPRLVEGAENYMVRLAIDPSIGSAHGRLYLAWLHSSEGAPLGGLPDSPNPIVVAHSDDGGRTFSPPVPVSDPARRRAVAPSLVVGADHAVHVTYYDLGADARDYQGLEGPVWEGQWSVVTSTSRDRGATFGAGVVVSAEVVPPARVMLIYTMPPPATAAGPGGALYAAWPDGRAGAPGASDVFLAQSGDGGSSWAPARRINDDPAGTAVTHELPRIGVSSGGRVDVAFLDRRNDPENLRADVYLTSSSDGGASFGPNVRLTSEPSDSRIGQRYAIPSAAGLVELGSRLAVLSRPNDALVAWPDMRNSSIGTTQQDVFATVVDFGTRNAAEASPSDAKSANLAVVVLAVALGVGAVGIVGVVGARRVRHRRRVD